MINIYINSMQIASDDNLTLDTYLGGAEKQIPNCLLTDTLL